MRGARIYSYFNTVINTFAHAVFVSYDTIFISGKIQMSVTQMHYAKNLNF